jgi:RNA polymerase sigma-70 factor (ECF subfamily)
MAAMSKRVVPLRLRSPALAAVDERTLLAMCARKDRAAFDEFFHRYVVDVSRYLSRLLGTGHPEREDLIQATFIAAADSIGRFQGHSTLKTWLLGIATNMASNHLRKQRRHLTAMEGLVALPRAPGSTPEDQAQRRQAVERLSKALHALDPARRAAFLLYEIEGVSGTEAARILGVTEGSLYRQLSEARARLRAALKDAVEGADE